MINESYNIVRNKIPCWLVRQWQYWKFIWYKRWKFILCECLPVFIGIVMLIDLSCWRFDNPITSHFFFRNIFCSIASFLDCHIEKYLFNNTFTISNVVGIMLFIIGLIAYRFGYFEYQKKINNLSIYNRYNYDHINFNKPKCISLKIVDRLFLINEEFNTQFSFHKFSVQPVQLKGSYELDDDVKEDLAWLGLEYFRKENKTLWNDIKIRLNMNLDAMSNLSKDNKIELMKTTYFDYLGSGFYSMLQWHSDNKEIYNGIDLMYDHGLNEFRGLVSARTAHHIGVNALLITKDKKFIIQRTKAPAAPDYFAPSGSGSLDIEDIDYQSFEKTLLSGALREFAQETGWVFIRKHSKNTNLEPIENFKYFPLGMSVDISRGMVTDFFFLILAENTSCSDYLDYYNNEKVIVDKFEVPLKNAMIPVDIINNSEENITDDVINNKLKELRNYYELRNCSMLTISIKYILALLEKDTEQSKYVKDFFKNPIVRSTL